MVIDAKGKDKRGNGTAGAHVTASMASEGSATRVEVTTDLHITGKPAQFGRGVMQDVSDKLLGQFTACLEQRLGATPESAPEEAVAAPAEPEVAPAPSPAPTTPMDEATPIAGGRMHNMRDLGGPGGAPPSTEDALDLGATVLPVLAKAYWKQALGVVLVLLVLRRLLRRGD